MTSKENIKDKVLDIIADQLDLDKANIKTESSFVDDLGADSLDTRHTFLGIRSKTP